MNFDSGVFLSRIPRDMFTLKVRGQIETPANNNQFFTLRSKKFPILGLYEARDDANFLHSETGLVGTGQGKILFFGDSSCMEFQGEGDCLEVIDVFVNFLRK